MAGGMIWAEKMRATPLTSAAVLQQRQRNFGALSSSADAGHRLSQIGIRQQGRSQRRRPLPERFRAALEHMSGMSMGDVRVHYGSSQPDAVEAHAYTQGNQIHLAPGQDHHLAHEAWHVVQQKQRRVRPTIKVANQSVNDSDGLEREADRMAVRIRSFSAPASSPAVEGMQASTAAAPVTQRAKHKNNRRRAPLTRVRAKKNLEVSPNISQKLIVKGKRQRKGVARYGIGDGTRTGIGAFAQGSLDTKRINRNFTKRERASIKKLGKTYGCHQCGSKNEAHYVPDHQPPLSQANLASYRGKLYPHCKRCSSKQGGLLSAGKSN